MLLQKTPPTGARQSVIYGAGGVCVWGGHMSETTESSLISGVSLLKKATKLKMLFGLMSCCTVEMMYVELNWATGWEGSRVLSYTAT